jgi:hypothetical protein
MNPPALNKLLKKYTDIMMVGFEESRKFYKHRSLWFIRHAVRAVQAPKRSRGKKRIGLEGKRVVMSFWGPLGPRT